MDKPNESCLYINKYQNARSGGQLNLLLTLTRSIHQQPGSQLFTTFYYFVKSHNGRAALVATRLGLGLGLAWTVPSTPTPPISLLPLRYLCVLRGGNSSTQGRGPQRGGTLMRNSLSYALALFNAFCSWRKKNPIKIK